MSERKKAAILLIFTAILWSFGGLLIKRVNWNPMAISGMLSAITAVFLLITLRRPNRNCSPAQIGGAISYAATMVYLTYSGTLMKKNK